MKSKSIPMILFLFYASPLQKIKGPYYYGTKTNKENRKNLKQKTKI